jgi:hypothetical protein
MVKHKPNLHARPLNQIKVDIPRTQSSKRGPFSTYQKTKERTFFFLTFRER